MSALPKFVQDCKNPVWIHIQNNKKSWLERNIRKYLSKESESVRYVYGYLRYVDKDNRGFAYPSQSTIAKATKFSARQVIRALAKLEKIGLIWRGKKDGHSYYIFILPTSLETKKKQLEDNIDYMTKQVESLGEKALKPHKEKELSLSSVTSKCHTSNLEIKKEIKNLPSPESKNQDWFSWIESKKIIKLTKEEQEALNNKEKEIRTKREKRFQNFPKSFKEAYLKELALAWVLKAYREIKYTREDCFLSKNEQFL